MFKIPFLDSLNHVHQFELWIILGVLGLLAFVFYELRILAPKKK